MTTSYFRRRLRETLGQITRDEKGRFVNYAPTLQNLHEPAQKD